MIHSLQKYHSMFFTKIKWGGRIESSLFFFLFLVFFFTLNMHCMKALGVVHLKGNGLNRRKYLPHCLHHFQIQKTPPPWYPQPSTKHTPVYTLCDKNRRVDTWTCVCVCVCFHCLADPLLGVSHRHTDLMTEARSHGTKQNHRIALHWKYIRLTVCLILRRLTAFTGTGLHDVRSSCWL